MRRRKGRRNWEANTTVSASNGEGHKGKEGKKEGWKQEK